MTGQLPPGPAEPDFAELRQESPEPAGGADLFLNIEVRAPFEILCELSARLRARQPAWDPALEEGGRFRLSLPFHPETSRADLERFEEAARSLEKSRRAENLEVSVRRGPAFELPAPPGRLGPYEILRVDRPEAAPPPRPDRLLLPRALAASPAWWQGEALLLEALSNWRNPPPGAPDAKGAAVLCLEDQAPLAALAAALAGLARVELHTANPGPARQLLRLNQKAEAVHLGDDGREAAAPFDLIIVHLSPYLAARRLKHLAVRLAEDGRLLLAGFTPGVQTAGLLRAAAKNGLALLSSATAALQGQVWAAMQLEKIPTGPTLPPLEISPTPLLEEPEIPELAALGLVEGEGEASGPAETPEEDGLLDLAEEEAD